MSVVTFLPISSQFDRSALSLRKIVILDKWEILPEQIEYKEELGRGAFGIVYKGTLRKRAGIDMFLTGKKSTPKEASQEVAVKVLPGLLCAESVFSIKYDALLSKTRSPLRNGLLTKHMIFKLSPLHEMLF